MRSVFFTIQHFESESSSPVPTHNLYYDTKEGEACEETEDGSYYLSASQLDISDKDRCLLVLPQKSVTRRVDVGYIRFWRFVKGRRR